MYDILFYGVSNWVIIIKLSPSPLPTFKFFYICLQSCYFEYYVYIKLGPLWIKLYQMEMLRSHQNKPPECVLATDADVLRVSKLENPTRSWNT